VLRLHSPILFTVFAWILAGTAPRVARAEATGDTKKPRTVGTEVSIVPFVGGDTDFGFGGGALGAFESYAPHRTPYALRVEAAGAVTFKPGRDDDIPSVPYQDYYLSLSWNVLASLRLLARVSYTDESALRYSGVGNAAPLPSADLSPTGRIEYFEWGWTHPSARIGARVDLSEAFAVQVENHYTQDFFDVGSDTKLRSDYESDDPTVSGLVPTLSPHAVFLSQYALIFDVRDDEDEPQSGQFHELRLRLAPGPAEDVPHRFGQANVTLRFYVTPVRKYLTLALRGVGDLLFGTVPFYELGRANDSFVLGGANGVRGVAGQHYYGKIKTYGNVELRSSFLPFELFDKSFELGAAAFFDAGRVWADYERNPALDGTGIGLKYGVGGGPRLRVGKPLIVRVDLAVSNEGSFGGYFLAGNIF
jgi:hypothetical protein